MIRAVIPQSRTVRRSRDLKRKRMEPSRARKERSGLSPGSYVMLPQQVSKVRAFRTCASNMVPLAAVGVKEQDWVNTHWREYSGRWVALMGDRLLADAPEARTALENARAAGVSSPFLIHVTEPSDLPFGGW
jgi:hypothetical protein